MGILILILSIWAVSSICKSKPPKIYKSYGDFDSPEECCNRMANSMSDKLTWGFNGLACVGSTFFSIIEWILKHIIQIIILIWIFNNIIAPFILSL